MRDKKQNVASSVDLPPQMRNVPRKSKQQNRLSNKKQIRPSQKVDYIIWKFKMAAQEDPAIDSDD